MSFRQGQRADLSGWAEAGGGGAFERGWPSAPAWRPVQTTASRGPSAEGSAARRSPAGSTGPPRPPAPHDRHRQGRDRNARPGSPRRARRTPDAAWARAVRAAAKKKLSSASGKVIHASPSSSMAAAGNSVRWMPPRRRSSTATRSCAVWPSRAPGARGKAPEMMLTRSRA